MSVEGTTSKVDLLGTRALMYCAHARLSKSAATIEFGFAVAFENAFWAEDSCLVLNSSTNSSKTCDSLVVTMYISSAGV